MLVLCCPGESFEKRIRKYLLGVLAPFDAEGNETSVYKKPSNRDHTRYIFKQSTIRYTPNYNYSPMYQDFPEEMTMRNLFTSYRRLSDMKLNTDKQFPTYKKQKKTHYEFLAIGNFYATIVPYKTTNKDWLGLFISYLILQILSYAAEQEHTDTVNAFTLISETENSFQTSFEI